jgi:hypothetical protein
MYAVIYVSSNSEDDDYSILFAMPTENNAYRLRQSDFSNQAFSDTENGIHPLEVSVRM